MLKKILVALRVVVVDFVAKAVCLVVNMDRMIGGQFEKGLADVKAVAEAAPRS
jgi:hypothetical protein